MADKIKVRVVADGDAHEVPTSFETRRAMEVEIADVLGVPDSSVNVESLHSAEGGMVLTLTIFAPEVTA